MNKQVLRAFDIGLAVRAAERKIRRLLCLAIGIGVVGTASAKWSRYPIFPAGADFAVESTSPEAFTISAKRTDAAVPKTGCLAIGNVNREMWSHDKLVFSVRSLNGKKVNVGATVSHRAGASTKMVSAPGMVVSGRAWREVVLGLDGDFGLGDASYFICQVKIGAWVGHWKSGDEGGIEVKNLRFCAAGEVTESRAWRPGDTFVSVPARPLPVPKIVPNALKVFFAFDNEDVIPSLDRRKGHGLDAQQYGGFRETLLEHLDGTAVSVTNLSEAQVIVYSRALPDPPLAQTLARAVTEKGVPLYAASEICDPEVARLLPCTLGHDVPEDLPPRAQIQHTAQAPAAFRTDLNDATFGIYRTCRAVAGAKTLLAFADGTPAVLEGVAGKGRVLYSMVGIGSSLVPGRESPDAFFVRALGYLTGRSLPERPRVVESGDGWRTGVGDGNFGRFGWEVGSGLLVGSLGSHLTVANQAASYEFALPRVGTAPRRTTFAGDRANPFAWGGIVTVDGTRVGRVDASLGYPGVRWDFQVPVVELYLNNLQGCAYLPTAQGVQVVDLSAEDAIDPRRMTAPWVLLVNGSEQDAPLLLVFQRRPGQIEPLRAGDAVQGLRLVAAGASLGVIVPTWIHGAERVDTSAWEKELPAATRAAVDLWHPRALAYPVACHEFFKLYPKDRRVLIKDTFDSLHAKSDWGVKEQIYAPVSPIAWMLHDVRPQAGTQPVARFRRDVVAEGLVTRFGDFAVRPNATDVLWALPLFDPSTALLPHAEGHPELDALANERFLEGVKYTCGGGVKVDYAHDRMQGRVQNTYNYSMHGHLLGMTRCTENPFIYTPENRRLIRRRLTWRLLEPLEVLQHKMVCRWRREPVSGVKYAIYMNSPRDISTRFEPAEYGSTFIYGDSNETTRMILAAVQKVADQMGQSGVVKANWDALSRHVASYPFAIDDWLNLCSGCLEYGGPGSIDMLNAEFASLMSLARLAEIAGDPAMREQAVYRASRRICPTLARMGILDYYKRHNLEDGLELRRLATGYSEVGAALPLKTRPHHEMDFFDMSQGIPRDLVSLYDWFGYDALRRDYLRTLDTVTATQGLDFYKVAVLALGGTCSPESLQAKLTDVRTTGKFLVRRDWPEMDHGAYIEYSLHAIERSPVITTCRDVNLHDAVYNPATREITLDVTPGASAALAVDGESFPNLVPGQRTRLTRKVNTPATVLIRKGEDKWCAKQSLAELVE